MCQLCESYINCTFKLFTTTKSFAKWNDKEEKTVNRVSKDDSKAYFRLTRNMMENNGDTSLWFHTCKRNMANYFKAFFYNKLLNIRSESGLTGAHTSRSVTNSYSWVPLNTFMENTGAEIRNIIKLPPVKSCGLDPLPTWLLKKCITEFVPLITDIVNMSLREFITPKSLKTALIRPHLKKTGLDSDILKKIALY